MNTTGRAIAEGALRHAARQTRRCLHARAGELASPEARTAADLLLDDAREALRDLRRLAPAPVVGRDVLHAADAALRSAIARLRRTLRG